MGMDHLLNGWSSKYCYSLLLGFSSGFGEEKEGPLSARCRMQNVGVLDDDTVDGQNPAPPRMMIIPLFIGF